MILSVSRRTDIPAFYSTWFYNRVKEGYVLVKNPMNTKQVSKIAITPELIDCIVFWTKNPKPMLDNIHLLNNFMYYFQFTLNSFDKSIEVNLPEKKYLIDVFIDLSNRLGKSRVLWRYDPILITDKFSKEYHYKWFEYLCERLHHYTEKCIISFYDPYVKSERNLKGINLVPMSDLYMYEIAAQLSKIASSYGLVIETCSELINLESLNIQHGRCIDERLISKLLGEKLCIEKDPNQREVCGCVKSIDIGEYNTCKHNCLYCYASFNQNMVAKNYLMHDTNSDLLVSHLNEQAKVNDREMISYRSKQPELFNDM